MSLCQQCIEHQAATAAGFDARNVQPHANLMQKGPDFRVGMSAGTIRDYTCKTCGAEWLRDTDKSDPGAGWSLAKQP